MWITWIVLCISKSYVSPLLSSLSRSSVTLLQPLVPPEEPCMSLLSESSQGCRLQQEACNWLKAGFCRKPRVGLCADQGANIEQGEPNALPRDAAACTLPVSSEAPWGEARVTLEKMKKVLLPKKSYIVRRCLLPAATGCFPRLGLWWRGLVGWFLCDRDSQALEWFVLPGTTLAGTSGMAGRDMGYSSLRIAESAEQLRAGKGTCCFMEQCLLQAGLAGWGHAGCWGSGSTSHCCPKVRKLAKAGGLIAKRNVLIMVRGKGTLTVLF